MVSAARQYRTSRFFVPLVKAKSKRSTATNALDDVAHLWHRTVLSVFIVMIETSSLRFPDILSFRISSTHPHTVCAAKMLPFPIFLFLLFSATLLAPPPPVLVGYFKITTLQSFGWNTLPTSPDPQTPEPAALISLQIHPVAPDTLLPTQCDPNSMLVANSTVPHSFVPPADFCTASTAVLLVVSLAMLNCLV